MDAAAQSDLLLKIAGAAPVIAVLVIEDLGLARPLAEALVAGGIPALEVTLRTPDALPAMRAMAEVPGALVGAGTVLTPEDLKAAADHGAGFAVAPGATARLLEAAEAGPLPLLPGAATASEVMALAERGYRMAKFFPAEAAGGAALLRGWAGPLPKMRFCPTGGLSPQNAGQYLAIPNVACIGGSWLAPPALLAARDWGAITRLARDAAKLRG